MQLAPPRLAHAELAADLAQRARRAVVTLQHVALPPGQSHQRDADVIPEILLEHGHRHVASGRLGAGIDEAIERDGRREALLVGHALAHPLPEEAPAAIETAQLVDDRPMDPGAGERLERHAAAVIEPVDGVDEADDACGHEVIALLHGRWRYAHPRDEPGDVRAVALDELRPRVPVAEPGLRPPIGVQAPPPVRTASFPSRSGRPHGDPPTDACLSPKPADFAYIVREPRPGCSGAVPLPPRTGGRVTRSGRGGGRGRPHGYGPQHPSSRLASGCLSS